MLPPERIRRLQQNMTDGGERAFSLVPTMLKNVIDEKQWEQCSDRHGTPFTSFEAFVTAELWEGLGSTTDELKAFCRKRDDVRQLIDEAVGKQPKKGVNQYTRGCDIITPSNRGTNPTYTLKRLKRDHPELAKRVVAGELSANAAAIEAGFRKKSTPLETILKQLPKLTDDQLDALFNELLARKGLL